MDEADRVLARLARIDRLRADGGRADLLGELRALVPEAEAWARAEGDARAVTAAREFSLRARSGSKCQSFDCRRTSFGEKSSEEAEGMS